MTDALHPDDELISAYLDGEATEAEIERVESSPELTARVDQLAKASALASAEVLPLPPLVVDDLIARALDSGGVPANVTDLAAEKARRVPRALVAVAAGVVALALAVPALKAIDSGSGSSNSAATSALAPVSANEASSQLDNNEKSFSQSSAAPEITAAAAGLPADTATSTAESAALPTTTTFGADVNPSAADAALTVRSIAGLPVPDPVEFDPLPAQFPAMIDFATLGENLTLAFSLGTDPTRSGQYQFPPVDVPPGCDLAVANYLAGPHPDLDLSSALLATDIALVSVDGSDNLLVLVRDAADHAMALVIDLPGCTGVTALEIAP